MDVTAEQMEAYKQVPPLHRPPPHPPRLLSFARCAARNPGHLPGKRSNKTAIQFENCTSARCRLGGVPARYFGVCLTPPPCCPQSKGHWEDPMNKMADTT